MAFYESTAGSGRTRAVSSRRPLEGTVYINPFGGASYWMTRPSPDTLKEWPAFQGQSRTPGGPLPPLDTGQTGRYGRIPNPYALNAVLFREHNQGRFLPEFENRRYLGGYSDDYASSTRVAIPYGSDNLSMRYHAYQKRPPTKMVYGKPVYREGMEANFAANLSVDQIRSWQAFFQANGFKTGPSGFWTEFELNAMRAFMTMANGVPGGGMDVNVLRARVENAVSSGELLPGELAPSLGVGTEGLNVAGRRAAGAPGDELEPYTETTTTREITEYSLDQGLMLLRSELARQIGRRPTEAEVKTFVRGLNAAQRADPSIITSVVQVNPAEGTTDTTTTRKESGVDPQAQAAQFAIEGVPGEERESYQANRYVDALMAELGF